ncbi:MAG TPA: hypothetical protein DEH22_08410 [Chloroflexi bacterium]|nr:hypothetical protein [Chloroflexota bacterium]
MQFTAQAEKEILAYQKAYPLRLGVPREELKSRLKQPARIFNAALSRWFSEGKFAETSLRQDVPGASVIPVVHMPEHQIALNSQQQQKIDRLLARFAENPAAPPTIKECTAEVGDELFNAMIDLGYVIPLNAEVVYRREDYLYLADLIRLMITTQGSISVAQVRDQLQTSRRYVLALLEHFDAISFTVRDGDVRKLKQR